MLTKKFTIGMLSIWFTMLFIFFSFSKISKINTSEETILVANAMQRNSVSEKINTLAYGGKVKEVKQEVKGNVKIKVKQEIIEVKTEVKTEVNQNIKEVTAEIKQDIKMTTKVEPKIEQEQQISDDLYWLSKIVYAESRGEDDKGQQMVAEVIMNRVQNPNFPKTIKAVIFEGDGKQFEPVKNGSINQEPDARAISNARKVLEKKANLIGDNILYFHATRLGNMNKGNQWWDGVITEFVHGGHVFAKDLSEG